MKKSVAILSALLLFAGIASAQPRAIGVRGGWGYEFSFQYTFVDYQFLEVDLGALCGAADYPIGFRTTGTYNFIFSEPTWTTRGDWAWYAGVGATVGIYHQGRQFVENDWVDVNYNYFMTGLVPQFGLEYTFWFPLQLSLDIRPTIGGLIGKKDAPKNGFYLDGITFGWIPALAVRYKF